MIKERLKEFKLAGMLDSLDERVNYANDQKLSYLNFLELLCEDEENNRRDNNYKKRYSKARLPSHKTLENFDFNFQPSIDRKLINDASTCEYIKEKKNIIFIGNPGTGKSHLSIGLGIKGLLRGYKVLFSTTGEMLRQLYMSKADNTYYRKLKEYVEPDLLILDELGFKKLPKYSVDDFFEIIAKRYENGSTIITTNKDVSGWGEIFEDEILAEAIRDRILHHAKIFRVNGSSYRSKDLKSETQKE